MSASFAVRFVQACQGKKRSTGGWQGFHESCLIVRWSATALLLSKLE